MVLRPTKGWVLQRLLPLLLFLYLAFVSTGFIHEGGHAVVADLVGIEVTGFSPTECLRLHCRVFAVEPLEGWRGRAVLLGGGLSASLWWFAVYPVTTRLHRKEGWWLGAATAAFLTGELMTALLEGGWNWLYSNYEWVSRLILFLAMGAGFAAQLKVTGQSFRIRQIWAWFNGRQG